MSFDSRPCSLSIYPSSAKGTVEALFDLLSKYDIRDERATTGKLAYTIPLASGNREVFVFDFNRLQEECEKGGMKLSSNAHFVNTCIVGLMRNILEARLHMSALLDDAKVISKNQKGVCIGLMQKVHTNATLIVIEASAELMRDRCLTRFAVSGLSLGVASASMLGPDFVRSTADCVSAAAGSGSAAAGAGSSPGELPEAVLCSFKA